MKTRYKIPIFLFLALFVSAMLTLCAAFAVLIHSSGKVSYDRPEIDSIIETGTTVTVVFTDQEEGSYGRYVGNLVIQLEGQTEKPRELRATVWTHDPQEETAQQQTSIHDLNPIYVTSEVLRIHQDHVVSVDLECLDGLPLSYREIRVDNAFFFNGYLFLTLSVFFTCLLFLADSFVRAYRKNTPAEGKILCCRAFAGFGLGVGILLCFCLPLNKVGADEETHLQAVVQLASFPTGELHISDVLMHQLMVTEFNNPDAQPGGAQEQEEFTAYLSAGSDYKNGSHSPEFYVPANRIPAYFSMAFFCKLGKGLSLPWTVILRLIRLANLFTYVALVYAALKTAPCGHALFLTVGLLPESLFLASTVSYDAFINGAALLSMAFLLCLLEDKQNHRKPSMKNLAGFSLPLLLACLVKAVYAPLFLAALMVPAGQKQTDEKLSDEKLTDEKLTDEKKADRKQADKKQLAVLLISGVAFVLLILIFIVPTLIDPSSGGDLRGGEVSIRNQLLFIVSNPLTYTGILLSQMLRWIPQCFLGPDCTTYMGHLVNGSTSYQGSWVWILLLLLFLTVAGRIFLRRQKTSFLLNRPERSWLLFLCFASAALIWTAMYLAFTPPGSGEIAGVQGRYFIPLLFPVYFALGAGAGLPAVTPAATPAATPTAAPAATPAATPAAAMTAIPAVCARLVNRRDLWYYLMIFWLGIALFLQLWKAVILPYCL